MSALENIPIEECEELVESSNIIVEYMGFCVLFTDFFHVYLFFSTQTYIYTYLHIFMWGYNTTMFTFVFTLYTAKKDFSL